MGIHNTGLNLGTTDIDIDVPEALVKNTSCRSIPIEGIDQEYDWDNEDLIDNERQNLA